MPVGWKQLTSIIMDVSCVDVFFYNCWMNELSIICFLLPNTARTDIQEAGVQYIIDSVVDELQGFPDRRLLVNDLILIWYIEINKSITTCLMAFTS